jgi:tetratricopeptide (TPR) repeat protein
LEKQDACQFGLDQERFEMFPKNKAAILTAFRRFFEKPMVLAVAFIVVVVVSQAAVILAFRQQQAKVLLNQASILLNAQAPPAQSEPYSRQAVELNPQDGYAWFYFGTAKYLQSEMPEAIQVLETAITVLPHSYNALRLLAFSHYKEQRFAEAAKYLTEYLTMIPSPPVSPEMVFRMAGLASLRQGDLATANHYLTRATDLVEGDQKGDLLRVRATVSLLCNQSWTAEYCFRAFRYYQPDEEFNPFELIANAAKTNKIPTTVGFFQAAHFRDRNDISVIKALAAAYMASGKGENAKTLLQQTVDRHPEDATLRLAYGDVLFANKEYRDAFTQYDEHLKLEPDSRYRQDILRKKATTRF